MGLGQPESPLRPAHPGALTDAPLMGSGAGYGSLSSLSLSFLLCGMATTMIPHHRAVLKIQCHLGMEAGAWHAGGRGSDVSCDVTTRLWPWVEIVMVRMIKISPSLSTDSRPDHSRQLTCSPNSHCLTSQVVCKQSWETGVQSPLLSEETTLRMEMEHRQDGRAGQAGPGAPARAVGSRACRLLRREPLARPACLD